MDTTIPEDIQHKIEMGELHEAISMLGSFISETGVEDDNLYYELGRMYWKIGDKGNAMSCYRKAVELNPQSKAQHALQLAIDVFNFYNPDLLNP